MSGILAYGAYLPHRRLQRAAIHAANRWFAPGLAALGRGERAVGGWDEDSVTMAVEAARDCLGPAAREGIDAVWLASTTVPFRDRQNAGIVKEALALPDATGSLDVGGSGKAGTSALMQALCGNGTSLCIAAERPRARPASEAEMLAGDAAAAFLIGEGSAIARLVVAHSLSIDFVDRFQGEDAAFHYEWESRWVRDEGYGAIAGQAISEALAKAELDGSAIDHFIAPIATRGVPEKLAKAAGVRAEAVSDTLTGKLGHSGAAHPLVMLADTLARARTGERLLVFGFGQGVDVLILEATEAIVDAKPERGVGGWLSRRTVDDNYLRYLSLAGHLALDAGMRAEFDQKQPLTALYRNRHAVLGLVGSRCRTTGAVQYPPSALAVGGAPGPMEDYRLADRPARVLTHTTDSLGYSPDPPGHYGMVEFEGGGRMACEFADVGAEGLSIGMPVRMMFRIKARDERRGFVQYFWKAVPA